MRNQLIILTSQSYLIVFYCVIAALFSRAMKEKMLLVSWENYLKFADNACLKDFYYVYISEPGAISIKFGFSMYGPIHSNFEHITAIESKSE